MDFSPNIHISPSENHSRAKLPAPAPSGSRRLEVGVELEEGERLDGKETCVTAKCGIEYVFILRNVQCFL